MTGRSRYGATRLTVSLMIAAGVLAGAAVLPTSSAQAAPAISPPGLLQSGLSTVTAQRMATVTSTTCVNASSVPVTCPKIISVSVGSAWTRTSASTPIRYSVTVVVDDPAGIALEMETYMGRGLEVWPPAVEVGYGIITSPASKSGIRKTFTATVESPYRPLYPAGAAPSYGAFQINPAIMGLDPMALGTIDPNNQFLTNTWRTGSIRARSILTNTPSTTSVRKGQWFTERGRLTRFDGTPQAGQKVSVYYVPTGQTRRSYAGTATTTSTGAWALTVRSWYTGTRFAAFAGSAGSAPASKGVLVRAS